jgi:signal transduction histidine kinase
MVVIVCLRFDICRQLPHNLRPMLAASSWTIFSTGFLLGLAACALASSWAVVFLRRRAVELERRAKDAERLAELGTLTGGLAHEIKNPLSTIQLNLQLLQEDLPATDEGNRRVSNRLATVRQEAGRLREILDDFLRYAGRIELEKSPADVGKLCEELVDFYMPQAQMAQVQLRFISPEKPVIANIDQRLVKQSLLNLMLNATQAMAGHNGGEILLSVKQLDDFVHIQVTDTGPGISEQLKEQIFQAYYTTKKGGTGLGLPMARRIAQEHGGQLTLTSTEGKGSSFTLELPVE